MKPILMKKRKIGRGFPCYVIAEIGSNFNGSMKKAKKLIYLAKKSGADCAKFQSFTLESLLSKTGFEKSVSFQSKWKKSVKQVYKDAELPNAWLKELSQYAKKNKIDFMTTPYNEVAVNMLIKLKSPAIKIGSGDITYLEFLKLIAKTKKVILLPCGASTVKEIKNAIKTIRNINNKIVLMQSVTQYPSPLFEANIKAMNVLGKKFNLLVGYSDHSLGITVPIAAVALGACVIEKHFTDNKKNLGPDHLHSLEPDEFKEMVTKIREVEKALGDGIKKIEKSEKQTRIIQRRSIFTTAKILKNEKITKDNTACLRPAIGISADQWKKIIGKKVKRNLKPYRVLIENDFY